MKYLLILTALALAGCQERYRYPCQDPVNWDAAVCKKPVCSSSYTCPQQLATPEVLKPDEEPAR